MNTLQLLLHLPLIKTSIPSHTTNFLSLFQMICSFDCLPHGMMNSRFFTFLKPKNVRFENKRSGYADHNYILNSGSTYWFIIFYFIGFIIFKLVFRALKRLGTTRLGQKVSGFFFYGFMIRLLIEGYLELLISALIQVKALQLEGRNSGKFFSLSGELVGFISAILILVISSYFRLRFLLSRLFVMSLELNIMKSFKKRISRRNMAILLTR